MFQYTKAAFKSLLKDFKLWSLVFTWALFGITVGYYIFACIKGFGFLWANITALVIIVVYTIIDVIFKFKEMKLTRKIVRKVYVTIKILLKGLTLALTIYGLYVASDVVNPVSIILATLMIIFWILTVFIEIVRSVFSAKYDMFMQAIHKDFDEIKKPIDVVGNTVKKIFGKEVNEQPKPKTRVIEKLEKIISEGKRNKKEK